MRQYKSEVNIVGKGNGGHDCPRDVPNVWTINDACMTRSRVDRIFQMHDLDTEPIGPVIIEQAQKKGAVLYSIREYKGTRLSERYPLEEIIAFFDTDYFTSSVDYMIALAVYEGHHTINLWGVNFETQDEERADERTGATYWIGMAEGMGTIVSIKGERSTLLKIKELYGFKIKQGELWRKS